MPEEYRLRLQISRVGPIPGYIRNFAGLVARWPKRLKSLIGQELVESCREHGDPLPDGLHACRGVGYSRRCHGSALGFHYRQVIQKLKRLIHV